MTEREWRDTARAGSVRLSRSVHPSRLRLAASPRPLGDGARTDTAFLRRTRRALVADRAFKRKAHMTKKPPLDIYQHVTDTIVAAIEANPDEYRMPWQRPGLAAMLPRNAVTQKNYNGINVLHLIATAALRQYPTTEFASFQQWQQVGAQVRKGAKGVVVVFYKEFSVDPDPEQDGDDGKRRTLRHSHVFNAADVDGYASPGLPTRPPIDVDAKLLQIVTNLGVEFAVGGTSACYIPSLDRIQMPDHGCFQQDYEHDRSWQFSSTLAHEAIHASGHPKRLHRDLAGRFGSSSYAFEELCALSGQSGCGLSRQSAATRGDL